MSRIGKLKIPCPDTVKVTQTGDRVVVKGPNGELTERIHPFLSIRIDSDGVQVEKDPEQRKADALSGLTRTLIANMVKGVTEGYKRELEIVGVGYRAELSGNNLVFQLGYSHKIDFPLPKGISKGSRAASKSSPPSKPRAIPPGARMSTCPLSPGKCKRGSCPARAS